MVHDEEAGVSMQVCLAPVSLAASSAMFCSALWTAPLFLSTAYFNTACKHTIPSRRHDSISHTLNTRD